MLAAMRLPLALTLALLATPALAQFPPPGIYKCANANGGAVGTLSLLVAGDYQFDDAAGASSTGQIASASTSVEALTGPLGDQHWRGDFSTDMGKTVFVFNTRIGKVTCK
jgi:hypothetical protein